MTEPIKAKNPTVRAFIRGLQRLEKEGNDSTLVKLFAEDSNLGNVNLEKPVRGAVGAARFWREYRHTFEKVESNFTSIFEAGDYAVLEWTSKGTLKTGTPVEYRGVSILTLQGNRISDFMAYYDSRHLTAH